MSRSLQQFTNTANSPRTWFRSGDDLLLAAKCIWDAEFQKALTPTGPPVEIPFRLFNGFFLLAGFGLESLFKGLRVSQLLDQGTSSVVTTEGKLDGRLKTHDLIKLATETQMVKDLDHNQIALLDRLTLVSTWAGRYPVEWKHAGKLNPHMLMGSDLDDIQSVAAQIRTKEKNYWPVISLTRSKGRTLTTRQSR